MPLLLDTFIDQNNIHHTEGRRGVVNLCKLVAALGYHDGMRFGQLENGAALGDLIAFLEDNSGCIEAVVNWIRKNEGLWADQLVDQVPYEDDEDEDVYNTLCGEVGNEDALKIMKEVDGLILEMNANLAYKDRVKANLGKKAAEFNKGTEEWENIE